MLVSLSHLAVVLLAATGAVARTRHAIIEGVEKASNTAWKPHSTAMMPKPSLKARAVQAGSSSSRACTVLSSRPKSTRTAKSSTSPTPIQTTMSTGAASPTPSSAASSSSSSSSSVVASAQESPASLSSSAAASPSPVSHSHTSTSSAAAPTSTACNKGTSADGQPANFEELCKFTCQYGYCPPGPCVCTGFGTPLDPPATVPQDGCPLSGESDGYKGLCSFSCNHNFCPKDACVPC